MLFLFLFLCIASWINAASQSFPIIQTKDEFDRFYKATIISVEANINNRNILHMQPAVRDAIGLQRFGHFFKSFKYMPPVVRLYAIEKAIVCYHFYIGALPSETILSSLINYASESNDKEFPFALKKVLQQVEHDDPASLRQDYFANQSLLGKVYDEEEMNALSELQSEFVANPEKFEAEIEMMFPVFNSLEDALKIVTKDILLIRNAVEGLKNVRNGIVESFFKEPGTRDQIHERLISIHINRCFCNKMLRLATDGLLNGNRESVAQVYAFVYRVNADGAKALPNSVFQELQKMPRFEKRRQFLEWKLLSMAAKMHGYAPDFIPENWYNHRPLLSGLYSRIMLALKQILTEEEQQADPKEFKTIGTEIKDTLLAKPFPTTLSPQNARKFFLEVVEKDMPRIIKKNKRFAQFSDLSEAEMQKLLRANFDDLDRDVKEANIMDFGGAEILADGNIESFMEETEPTSAGGLKVLVPCEEKEEKKADAEAIPKEIDPVEVKEDCEEDPVEAECRQIEEEQRRIIEEYRLLKKLKVDHAKLHRHTVLPQTESMVKKEKPRVVACFHTDDLRLILPEANKLFTENQVNDTARQVINAGKDVRLRWFFNPDVVIDFTSYHFLCQLFSLTYGRNLLSFDVFLKTFQKLSPMRTSMMTKKEFARSVFQFDHAFETVDQVFVPPIGGAHREHMSSDFNHDVILKFMMRGGAHPYFFELL